jgi:hypothetical protein
MKLRVGLYVLPLLVAGLWLIGHLVLDALGAECVGGDLIDGGMACNGLGETQWVFDFGGFLLTLASIGVWAVGLVANRVGRRRRGQRTG